MKTKSIHTLLFRFFLGAIAIAPLGCKRDLNELQPATASANGDVFIDTFSSGLNYAAFGGSVPAAFQVDTQTTYNSSTASMRIEIPDYNDPRGAYAGGAYFTSAPRDLSGYTALTFWMKASQAATVDVLGFGNDMGASKYQVTLSGVAVNTNWKKYIIPIPDASKLKMEKGMFFYSEGPENNKGYTLWIDEVKFENLGTVAFQSASILGGQNKTLNTFNTVSSTIDGLAATFNLPTGVNETVSLSPYYFNFTSSNTSVATVSEKGFVNVLNSGSSVIKATMGSNNATGSLTINSSGAFVHAPTPTVDKSKVISIFSDVYTNAPVDYYNGYWSGGQTTQSADFAVNGDHVLNYTNFNYVGIQFTAPTINVSSMSHLHTDIYVPNALASGATLQFQVIDFGADGVYGGNDDKTGQITYAAPVLQGQKWVSLDIPLKSLTGLTTKGHIAQIVFVGNNLPNFYADNIFFYNDGSIIPVTPTVAAPTPTANASSVLSVFSDAYTNVAGTDFNPSWGQATVVSQVNVAGNNTLKYAGLTYQGTQLASNINVSSYGYLHLDYYTANSSTLNVYLISPGPKEKPYALIVPTSGSTGWKSIDIPLSAFSSVVDLTKVFQFKFDGNGDIFLDNIYFHN